MKMQLIENKDENKIKGGKADNIPKDKFCMKKVEQGAKVEMEHTDDKDIARKIAMDHLSEKPDTVPGEKIGNDYYDELDKMEKDMKKEKKE